MSTLIKQNDPHMASSSTEDFKEVPLLTGDTPLVSTTAEIVADAVIASADLPANSVVGRDSTGKLVKATYDADPEVAIKPVGITTATGKTGSTAKNVPMYRTGCFNPEALIWDASFNTAEKKRLAFEGTGADIIIRAPGYPIA